jgi:prolyl-tRNA editing enzyme YbaK/EbsC (Cys-tRNA(Pro) deacylase)
MDLHRNSQRVVAVAAEHGLTIHVQRFPEGTRTAQDAAAAIGCDVGAIVKSIVVSSDAGPLLVLTSGSNLVDFARVAAVLDTTGVRRADAEEARAATGYPIGGTAPWGHPQPLTILCDEDLLGYETVWAAAGTPDTVFPLSPDDLLRITQAQPAAVARTAS